MTVGLRNVVVIGGSYVGFNTAQQLAAVLPVTHRVVLVEPHTHFNHLFAFPRFAVVPGYEHKAFIPYTGVFKTDAIARPDAHAVVQARAVGLSVTPGSGGEVTLDRAWEGSTKLPFDYVALATGTRLVPPGTLASDSKADGVSWFQDYQKRIGDAKHIAIVGGGAVGVQMASDIKEAYPDKEVALIFSRRLMPRYHEQFHALIEGVLSPLGVELVKGRAVAPEGGWVNAPNAKSLKLEDGREIKTDLVIPATGQIPNNELAVQLDPKLIAPNGFVRVKPTMQLDAPGLSHCFAIGDIADSGAHKAARPAAAHAVVLAHNVEKMIEGREPDETITVDPAAIHLTLGMQKNIVFRNPPAGETEPSFRWRDDGKRDMGIDGVWARRGVRVNAADEYHL